METFQSNIQSFVVSTILNPISEWLIKEKKIDVSVDELLELLKITQQRQVKPSNNSLTQSTITTLGSSGVLTTKAKPKSKPPSKEKETESSEKFGNCKYVFKRGELKGKECGKALKTSDSEYCEQCNKKVTKPTSDTKGEVDKKPVETSKPSVGFTTSVAKKAEKLKVELREAGGQPNTYIDVQTNIVVKKVLDGDKAVYVAVGVQEENGFRTLTEEEKKDAMKRGFTLQNPSTSGSAAKSEVKVVEKEKEKEKPKVSRPVNGIPDIDSDNE